MWQSTPTRCFPLAAALLAGVATYGLDASIPRSLVEVVPSVAPGNVEIFWANCIGRDEADIGECCETSNHAVYAFSDACRRLEVNANWGQILDLDEQQNLLFLRHQRLWRMAHVGSDQVVPEEIENMPTSIHSLEYNPNSGDMYFYKQYGCEDYVSEAQITKGEALEDSSGITLRAIGTGPSMIRRTADGNVSLVFGMCRGGAESICWPTDFRGQCNDAMRERGQRYLDRLYEVNAGAWIDPTADLAVHYTEPRAIVVDPDTNDLYIADWEMNYWPKRNVVWKYDAARQQARVVAGHFAMEAPSGMVGFGGPAIAAHLGSVYHIALHPITKELHIMGYGSNFAKVDVDGNLQQVECVGCGGEMTGFVYHKGEEKWIMSGLCRIFWQNGTTIVGIPGQCGTLKSYKNEADQGPWEATDKIISHQWGSNMALDEIANLLYFTDMRAGAIMVVKLFGQPATCSNHACSEGQLLRSDAAERLGSDDATCCEATSTTSTTSALQATCSMRRMGCPVPEEYSQANYTILGSERGAAACRAQGTGSSLYFEFGVDECNTTVGIDEARGWERYTATLVPYVMTGGLDFVDWPDIVCSCEVDTSGTVISTVVAVVDKEVSIEGRSEFEPAMTMYLDDAFAEPLPDVGGGFSVSSERFFFGISSNSTEDIISVADCSASPSAEADDPFVQVVWEAHCPVGPFDAGYHEHAPKNELHLSMRSFKFAGFGEVVLTCTIIRCPQEPCGVCDPDARRRLQLGGAADTAVTRSLRLTAGPESKALVLPGFVDQSSLAPLFSLAVPRQMSSPVLESSATLLNCPISSDERFVDALESALEAWLGMADVEVTILEVLATGIQGSSRLRRRQLQGGAGVTGFADAVLVRFEVAIMAQDEAEAALDRVQTVLAMKSSEALADAVSTELETSFGVQAENLLTVKGPVERRADAPTAEPVASSDGSGNVDVVFVALAAGAGMILGCCLVSCGILLRRYVGLKRRCSSTPPAAAAAAEAAEAAAAAAETGGAESSLVAQEPTAAATATVDEVPP